MKIAHEPEYIDDLIVNIKKIDEVRLFNYMLSIFLRFQVRTWLRNKINRDDKNKCLLITGPAGCGKSTTVRLLCDELDIACVEFELESGFKTFSDFQNKYDTEFNETQINSFRNFIAESQSKTVERSARTRKLILIRELPVTMIK